uniref:Uncharacterized protein n=1 Tax=Rhizophora mucronata TaxID=61149 RepID=A0A2P2NK13_RHIMU
MSNAMVISCRNLSQLQVKAQPLLLHASKWGTLNRLVELDCT